MAKSRWNKNTKGYDPENPQNHSERWLDRMAEGNRNGNLWQVREAHKLMNSFKDYEVFPELRRETEATLYDYEKMYWTEFFYFRDKKTGELHEGMEFAKPFIIDSFFDNVGVGLILDSEGNVEVYRLTAFWRNPYYQVTRAHGIIYAYPMDQESAGKKFKERVQELSSDNAALVLSSAYGRSWFYGLKPFMTRWQQSFNARDINIINSMNIKVVATDNISENALKEAKQIQMGNVPVTVVRGQIDDFFNLGLENNQKAIWEDEESLWKVYSRIRGIRFNLDQKGDRNISAEVGNNDTTFLVVEGRRRRVLTELIKKINKIFKTDLEVISVLELNKTQENKAEAELEGMKAKETSKYTPKPLNSNHQDNNQINQKKKKEK